MTSMSDSKTDKEPSIEEILSSIRQIINEDDTDTDTADTNSNPAVSNNEPQDDVLDLAAFSQDDDDQAPSESEAISPMPDEKMNADDLDAMFDEPAETDTPAADFAFEDVQTPTPSSDASPTPMNDVVEDSLMSEDTISAAAASLTKLAEAEIKIDHAHASGNGSITLEDVVKQMLKPMMKEWLDGNLPAMVERLVEKEIRKISNR